MLACLSYDANNLFLQVHQNVARFLEDDKDVTNYAETCRASHQCMNDSLWARKFSETFDPLPVGATIRDIREEYQDRKCMASCVIKFDDPEEAPLHRRCGQVLRDLILRKFLSPCICLKLVGGSH
jgi:hypothetical protein